MKKKLACIVLCMSLTAGLLTGCGGSGNSNVAGNAGAGDTAKESESAAGEESSGDAEAPAQSADGAASISFWKWIPTEGLQIDTLMDAWKAENPDINIEVTHVGESNAYFEKISAALPAGEGPTVIAMQVGARANQFKEYLEPLDSYAAAEWGDDWESKFLDTAIEQCRFSADENATYYVMPGGMTAVPIIEYNAAAFEKLGIKEAPRTMEDIYAVIEATKADPDMIPGVAIGANQGWACRDIWMSIIQQIAPGKIYEAENGNASFTDPEFIESFEIWKEMWDNGFFADGSLGMALYPDVNDNYNMAADNGNKYFIMESNGTWHGSGLPSATQEDNIANGMQSADLVRGMFTLPSVKEGTSPASVASVDICWGINRNASEEEKQAAWKFIAWMSEGKGQEIWANTLQILPCDKDSSLDQAYADIKNDYNKAALELCEEIVANASGAREMKYAEITNAINDGLVAIAADTMTIEEVAQTIQMASESVSR